MLDITSYNNYVFWLWILISSITLSWSKLSTQSIMSTLFLCPMPRSWCIWDYNKSWKTSVKKIKRGFSLLRIIQGNEFFFKQRTIRWLGLKCNNSPWVDSTCFGMHELSKEPSLCFGDYYIFIQIHHHQELMKST